jgi:hypothetical protein
MTQIPEQALATCIHDSSPTDASKNLRESIRKSCEERDFSWEVRRYNGWVMDALAQESRSRPCSLDSISCVGWIAPGRAEIALFDTQLFPNCSPMWIFAGPGSGESLGAMARGRCSVFRGRRATPAMARNDPEGQESPANEEPSLD